MLSTEGAMISDISVNEYFGAYDHAIINSVITLPSNVGITLSKKILEARDYNKDEWIKFRNELVCLNWEEVFDGNDMDTIWPKLKRLLECSVVKAIPFKKRKAWSIESILTIEFGLHFVICGDVARIIRQINQIFLLKLVQAKFHLTKLVEGQEHLYCIYKAL